MPDANLALLIIIFIAAIAFGASNGMNDAANAVAAAIGSRAIRPKYALMIAAVGNMVGALTGIEVAKTIGKGIVTNPDFTVALAAVSSAVIWTLIATRRGLPISVSHSLVSGLVGAGVATSSDMDLWGFWKTLIAVVAAPTLGFLGAFILMIALLWAFYKFKPGITNNIFRKAQWATVGFLSYAHGKNDGQMPIGLMVMGLGIYKGFDYFGAGAQIPLWIIIIGALSISLGTAFGGWRVIKTMGFKVTALQPIHGFASEAASAGVIEFASHLGVPVSTTHCGVATVIGVGATNRLSAVRWGLAKNIVFAWILTFPICLGLGWALAKLFMM